MEELTPTPTPISLKLNIDGILHLRETRRWTNFMAIMGFIFIGLMLAGVVGAFFVSQFVGGNRYLSIIPLLLLSVLYYFPIRYLWNFSKHSKLAIEHSDSNALELAMKYLKMHYRFMGIMVIVILAIYVMIAAFGLLALGMAGL